MRVNETEKPFKDSRGYPPNPLNPSNLPIPSNPPSPPHPSNPCLHPPNPRFKDPPRSMYYNIALQKKNVTKYKSCYFYISPNRRLHKLANTGKTSSISSKLVLTTSK